MVIIIIVIVVVIISTTIKVELLTLLQAVHFTYFVSFSLYNDNIR